MYIYISNLRAARAVDASQPGALPRDRKALIYTGQSRHHSCHIYIHFYICIYIYMYKYIYKQFERCACRRHFPAGTLP